MPEQVIMLEEDRSFINKAKEFMGMKLAKLISLEVIIKKNILILVNLKSLKKKLKNAQKKLRK